MSALVHANVTTSTMLLMHAQSCDTSRPPSPEHTRIVLAVWIPAAHLLALKDVTRAICALGIKAQARKLIVAEALKCVLDEGRGGNPSKGLGHVAGIHVVPTQGLSHFTDHPKARML